MALVTLALVTAAAASAAAIAGSSNPGRQPSLDRMVRFLQESQRPSGGFASPGKKPSQGISAWVALALAAAGVNPQDQATCGVDAFAFLQGHFDEGLGEELAWPQTATTAFERELLVVDAAGTDPHDFAGTDLVAEILDRKLPNGSFPYVPGGRGEVNDTVFAMLALSPIDEPAAAEAVQRGADWLLTQQNEDGGWSWEVKGEPSEVDLTGAAVQALNAAKRESTEARAKAFEYLRAAQKPDGGFAEFPESEAESNVASTAWAVQGLWAAGENPETWLTGSGEASEEPLDYMESMQQPDGHARWKKSVDMNGIWMTAYVAPAFAGQALPIAAVPRAAPGAFALASVAGQPVYPQSCEEPKLPGESPRPAPQSPKPGGGVIAGGGAGAPLFSRPKPQSKGRTPGGARLLGNQSLHPRNHSKIRRGANREQPSGAERSEPRAAEAEVSSVSGSTGKGTRRSAGGDSRSGGADTGSDPGGGPQLPPALANAAGSAASGEREVTGTLIGATSADGDGDLAFGAPGLRSAGTGGAQERWLAIGVGAAVLLAALGGAQLERRRREAIL
jgi:hypothetical protein